MATQCVFHNCASIFCFTTIIGKNNNLCLATASSSCVMCKIWLSAVSHQITVTQGWQFNRLSWKSVWNYILNSFLIKVNARIVKMYNKCDIFQSDSVSILTKWWVKKTRSKFHPNICEYHYLKESFKKITCLSTSIAVSQESVHDIKMEPLLTFCSTYYYMIAWILCWYRYHYC